MALAQIILFLEMLKISKIIFLNKIIFGRKMKNMSEILIILNQYFDSWLYKPLPID
jgi:hypothetical protein